MGPRGGVTPPRQFVCSVRVGIARRGGGVEGGELNPLVHVYRRSFLSENRFKISIPVQNFKHFDI